MSDLFSDRLLDAMDEAYRKHHLWAYPKLKQLPSEYFRSNGATTFQEDRVGLDLAVKYNLVDNFMWANDYPHHEGVWPHSAESIERQMAHLNEEQRAKILGLNAARIFKFDVDALMRRRDSAVRYRCSMAWFCDLPLTIACTTWPLFSCGAFIRRRAWGMPDWYSVGSAPSSASKKRTNCLRGF